MLLFFSNAFILHEVNRIWEPDAMHPDSLGHHEIGVVLGGYATLDTLSEVVTFRNTADRFIKGVHLLQSGKVDRLVLSGGSGYLSAPELRESVFVRQFADGLCKSENIYIEPISRNTYQNALRTKMLLDSLGLLTSSVVLITSAFHMPRAQACFEKQGIEVTPYPTDVMHGERYWHPEFVLLPKASALAHWKVLIHEWVGYLSYLMAGYL
ncbi:MAG: hypothetical protein Kow0075_09780 [Salibacteraceae bacterium]